MSRVQTFQIAAARNQTSPQTREAASRPERVSFALPEMLNQAAARQVARPAPTPARNEVAPTRAAPERPRDRPERPRGDRDQPVRSRDADRTSPSRERRESRPADHDRPAERPQKSGTDEAKGPAEKPETADEANGTAEASSDTVADPTAAVVSEIETAATPPGLVVSGALGLPLPGALAVGSQAAAAAESAIGAARARAGDAAADAAAGHESDRPDQAGSEGHRGHPPGEAVGKPAAGVVTALLGRQPGGEGDEKGAPGGEGFSALLDQIGDSGPSGPGAAGRPAFTDVPGQAGAADGKPGASAQRAVITDVAVGRVPIEIGLRSLEGSNQFEIRLTPEELGRVDVRLDIDEGGEVKAHLIVERPEALALLTRDRAQLERAFEQAGLRPADGGIAFSLRDGTAENGNRSAQDGQGEAHRGPARPGGDEIGTKPAGATPALPRAILSRLGALDLKI